jgi:transposase
VGVGIPPPIAHNIVAGPLVSCAPKRGPGQPTKLTPETQEKILAAVRAGNYLETAAAFAGISKKTLYQWLQRGARTRTWTIYRAFSEALAEALAVAEVADVANVARAAKDGQWQASAWRLERKFPDR